MRLQIREKVKVSNRTQDRISSDPDALDFALNLGGVFDGDLGADDWGGSDELTARASDHVPSPSTADDDDAPAPEDLGRTWLEQATETERSLGVADTIPDIEALPDSSNDVALESDDEDETTQEYVRRHRISRVG